MGFWPLSGFILDLGGDGESTVAFLLPKIVVRSRSLCRHATQGASFLDEKRFWLRVRLPLSLRSDRPHSRLPSLFLTLKY